MAEKAKLFEFDQPDVPVLLQPFPGCPHFSGVGIPTKEQPIVKSDYGARRQVIGDEVQDGFGGLINITIDPDNGCSPEIEFLFRFLLQRDIIEAGNNRHCIQINVVFDQDLLE